MSTDSGGTTFRPQIFDYVSLTVPTLLPPMYSSVCRTLYLIMCDSLRPTSEEDNNTLYDKLNKSLYLTMLTITTL